MELLKPNIILGSQSPRRRELMAGLDIPFTCVTIDADESYPAYLQAGDIPLYISRAKAHAYTSNLHENDLLITSDTIVWLNGKMLGKPNTKEEAKQMLNLLSGHTHQVYTAVCFTWLNSSSSIENNELTDINYQTKQPNYLYESFVDCTDVTFRTLTTKEIEYYVEKYMPLDKAGAYGVQEWIGYIGVQKMHGSYFNVMGFPIGRVYEWLNAFYKA
ncbi:MAG: Maf family protein [Paludibacteraceae bacterium]|nr:Maf family protein [Paludibacteraceae bacterium]